MHLPNILTDVDILAQGKEALRSAEMLRKIFCMGVHPHHFDCLDAVPMTSPRLCWCSESVGSNINGVQVKVGQYWSEVEAKADYTRCWMNGLQTMRLGQDMTKDSYFPQT